MASTKNHKPLANYKKVAKLDELSRKFDLPYDKEISPLNKTDLINVSDDDNHDFVFELTNQPSQARQIDNPNKIPPIATNDLGTKDMFHQRKYYKENFLPTTPTSQAGCETEYGGYRGVSKNLTAPVKTIDLLYNRTFYGRVDHCGCPVYPSEIFLKPVVSVEQSGKNSTFLINFVADSFSEMSKYIKRLGDSGKFTKEKSNYFPFVTERGWTSIHEQYHQYMEAMYSAFMDEYLMEYENLKKIRNFGDWLNYFVNFLDFLLSSNAITRSNFILKKEIDPRMSGLVVELTETNHDRDRAKYADWIRDENFSSILDIADRFGFYIDRNAPWRFFADINSVPMKDAMAKYGYNGVADMFDKVYYKAYLYDMEIIKTYITSFYNSFATGNPITNVVLPNPTDTTKTMRKIITRDVIADFIMTDRQMLALYYYIRAKESSKTWDQKNFDFEVDYAYGIFKSLGTYDALLYINEKTKISFDNGGNPGQRQRIVVKNRINDNINSSKTSSTFKFNIRRY
tara:strand:- start:1322 stop:2860 length:1539 start_codon:yes stop_codon:yes gene_type:complete